MKRPHGFDQPASDARAFVRRNQERNANRPTEVAEIVSIDALADEHLESSKHSDEPAGTSRPKSDQRWSARTRELRKARRDRKKYERSEIKRFTKSSRRRRIIWIGSLSSVMLIVLVAVMAAFSPLMSLQTIDIVGTSRLKPADIEKALAGQEGKPLPLIDFGEIKAELSHFPLVRSYSTEVHPPNTLVVRIVERKPVGLVKTSSGYDLVDAAKVVIQSSKKRPGRYPLIEVPASMNADAAASSFAASSSVITALPVSVAPKVKTVTAKTTDDVTFTLVDGRTVVWGGPSDSELKAADLSALLKKVPKASTYDVSSPMNPITK